MRLSFIAPVLNESPFIKAWIKNVERFADEIFVLDCGSTDGTKSILVENGVYPVPLPPELKPQSPYDWQEGKIRNLLISKCTGDYIVNLDADELLPSDFKDVLSIAPDSPIYRLWHRDFWYSQNLIRVRQLKRDYWRRFWPSTQIRVFRNDGSVRYAEAGNHSGLLYRGKGKWATRAHSYTLPISFYHFHHILRPKVNENRKEEAYEPGLKLETYWGPWPEEVKYYDWFDHSRLERRRVFGKAAGMYFRGPQITRERTT
jgi:glycosyltransferase involved in cell wall biosynthesis